MSPHINHRWAIALASFVGLVAFAVYYPSLANEFITLDTRNYVTANEHIRQIDLDSLGWMFTSFRNSNWHPLAFLSHALDYQLFGLDPAGHRLTNLVLHALNTTLVFVLALALARSLRVSEPERHLAPAATLAGAFIAAMLFGVHPQHVESVVWVAERKDLLCQFFLLLTLLAYLQRQMVAASARPKWSLVVLASFALALMSKPMAVTLPAILLLLDAYPLRRLEARSLAGFLGSLWPLMKEKLPLFGLSLGVAALTILAQRQGGTIGSFEVYPLPDRILNAFNGVFFYLSKWLAPFGLSAFYPYPDFGEARQVVQALAAALGFAGATALCVLAWRRGHRYFLIAWLFYLVALSPVIGILQVGSQAAADRYAYFPTLPAYLLAGFAIAVLLVRARAPARIALVLTVVLAAVFLSTVNGRQQQAWRDDIVFWTEIVRNAPLNGYTRFSLGNALLERGRFGDAAYHYQAAEQLQPERGWNINLPIAYLELGMTGEAEAVLQRIAEQHRDSIGHQAYVKQMQGWIHLQTGHLDEASALLREALELAPDNPSALHLLEQVERAMSEPQVGPENG